MCANITCVPARWDLRRKKNCFKNNKQRKKLSVGTSSLPYTCVGALTEAEDSTRCHHAYKLLGSWVKRATTNLGKIELNDASMNHWLQGMCQWLFKHVCWHQTGWKENHFIIEPHPVFQLENTGLFMNLSGIVESRYGKSKGMTMYIYSNS